MGRPRKYSEERPATPAERKAAQRERDKAEWVEVSRAAQEAHSARLEALQRAVSDAAKQGDAAALACRAGSVDTMLDKLTAWFEARAQDGASTSEEHHDNRGN